MIKVVFVCTGNICRSPMAEAIMTDLVEKADLEDKIKVDSAGIISYHTGEMADPRARKILAEHDIEYLGEARQIKEQDFEADYIIGMTQDHIEEIGWAMPKGYKPRIHLLLDFVDNFDKHEIPDPYYSGAFETAYQLIQLGCEGLLRYLIKTHDLKTE